MGDRDTFLVCRIAHFKNLGHGISMAVYDHQPREFPPDPGCFSVTGILRNFLDFVKREFSSLPAALRRMKN
jgi:hypothetical protein